MDILLSIGDYIKREYNLQPHDAWRNWEIYSKIFGNNYNLKGSIGASNLMSNAFDQLTRAYLAEKIKKHCMNKKDLHILDYGCGSAAMTLTMFNRPHDNIYLYEEDNEQKKFLLLLAQNNTNVYIMSSVHGAMKFDVTFLMHILEHISNPLEELEERTRMLEKDGLLFLEAPFEYKEPSHIPITKEDLSKIIEYLEKNYDKIDTLDERFIISGVYKKK